jgi:hypothetical protein
MYAKRPKSLARALQFLSIPLLIVGIVLGTQAQFSAAASEQNDVAVTDNRFQIEFLGMVENGDGTSTWNYEVTELNGSRDLSNWVLELGDCVEVVDATAPHELVDPDPNADLSGIKWETSGFGGDDFESGVFSVRIEGPVTMGMVAVAAKGPKVAWAEVIGPVCDAGSDNACVPASDQNDVAVTENDFQIEFMDMVDNGDGTSTWSYEVTELEGSKDLSNWVLELGDCVEVVDATEPYELVDPDPNADLTGIKWETSGFGGDDFESGVFTVTIRGVVSMGTVAVAAKGPKVAWAEVTGPVCGCVTEPTPEPTAEPTAVPTAEPTAVPTAEPTAEPTPTTGYWVDFIGTWYDSSGQTTPPPEAWGTTTITATSADDTITCTYDETGMLVCDSDALHVPENDTYYDVTVSNAPGGWDVYQIGWYDASYNEGGTHEVIFYYTGN